MPPLMVGWALACALLLVITPLLPAAWSRHHLWALAHLREVALWQRLALAALCLAVVTPSANRLLWRALDAVADGLPARIPHRGIRLALASTCLVALFWLLRSSNFALGDSADLVRALTLNEHLGALGVTYDEPLELLLHAAVYRFLHRMLDLGAAQSYAIVSSLCGLASVLMVASLWRRRTTGGRRPDRPDAADGRMIGVALFLCMGATQLFYGYVENYSIVTTGVLLYILLAERSLAGACHPAWAAAVLSTSVCFHVLAGWLLPSLLLLYMAGYRSRGARQNLLRLGAMVTAVALPICATIALLTLLGIGPAAIKDTHLWQLKFYFLLEPGYRYYRYSMFSARHLADIVNQLLLVALPGIICLSAVLPHARTIDRKDPFLRFLVFVAGSLQVFAATWHPDLGPYRDWDLFAIVGVGYTLLGTHLVLSTPGAAARLREVGSVAALLSLFLTATWIGHNAASGQHEPQVHDIAHLQRGIRLARQGRPEAAVAQLLEAARSNPANPTVQLGLAQLYRALGDKRRALQHLERYRKLTPHTPGARTSDGPTSRPVRPGPRPPDRRGVGR